MENFTYKNKDFFLKEKKQRITLTESESYASLVFELQMQLTKYECSCKNVILYTKDKKLNIYIT